jgi:DNA-binding transcriptional LysR family regulator
MEYRDVRLFVEVVRQAGFSQAARQVGVSQSAVSKAVKALETEFGVVLLVRGRQPRSKLSSAGELVYQRGL